MCLEKMRAGVDAMNAKVELIEVRVKQVCMLARMSMLARTSMIVRTSHSVAMRRGARSGWTENTIGGKGVCAGEDKNSRGLVSVLRTNIFHSSNAHAHSPHVHSHGCAQYEKMLQQRCEGSGGKLHLNFLLNWDGLPLFKRAFKR